MRDSKTSPPDPSPVPGGSDEDRKQRERDFHNTRFSDDNREEADKFYAIIGASVRKYRESVFGRCKGNRVLEYGCGQSQYSAWLLERNAGEVVGIDLSDVAIGNLKKKAASTGLHGAEYLVMDAEKLGFAAGSFDLICGRAILHHLNLDASLAEIARVLRNGGTAVFSEPLGHNPAINLYRRLTPALRTPDEHPLLMKDVAVLDRYFGKVEVYYYHFLGLAAVPFRRTAVFAALTRFLDGCDRVLFRLLPPLRRWAWAVVFVLSEPRKAASQASPAV